MDRLLMRCLPRLTGRTVYTGDVVAIKPPQGTESSLLVRRIAAVEGDEIVSNDPEDTAFTLSKGESESVQHHILLSFPALTDATPVAHP